jgi:hypothetical protein
MGIKQGKLMERREKVLEKLNWIIIPAVVVVLCGLLALNIYLFVKIADLNRQQIIAVQVQNNAQLCVQHDIVVAIKSGFRKGLGVPTNTIEVPDIGGLDCNALLHGGVFGEG